MNPKIRRYLRTFLSVRPINYMAILAIKAFIALNWPFPFKGKIHRFPLPFVSAPFKIRVSKRLAAKIGRTAGDRAGFREGSALSKELTFMLMNPDESSIENALYFFGIIGHEPEMLPIIFSLANRLNYFLDIGSNSGHYSLIISAINKDCSIFAFEPSPINIEWCRRNIVANGFSNCHLIPMAVSDYTGKTRLFSYDKDSTPTIIDDGLNTEQKNFIEVDVITIDDFIEQENLANIDLVKVDVELAEPEVLEGMKKCMKKYSPIIICEVLYAADVNRIRKILNETGYRAYHIGTQGRLKSNDTLDRNGTVDMRNFLFTNKPLSDIGLSKFEIDI